MTVFSHCTENHIFFFQASWKDGVSKKSRWNLNFLVLSENMIFLFPENMILPPDGKWKMTFLKKNTRKYEIYFKCSEKMDFPKRTAPGLDLSCIIWKGGIFSREHGIFSLDGKRERNSQEIHGNMIFSTWYVQRPPAKIKVKDDPIPQKYT